MLRSPRLFISSCGPCIHPQFLLDWGADIDHVDDEGNTALHYAAGWGHSKCVTILIDRGCNANLANRQGWTAANYAYSFSLEMHLKGV
ncbi:ankyrin repeat-containing domain protein [Jimgerdemannia flammicorona]|uniref:Ankyrin repeat-containing domain protein n=1 Tax=Jimgerdemannia flammicorona TaxID=994334 RepID=A0A433Q1F3_9FUNG|nr:ankyrin repeat-containing domain protein [Jimgerdemannia flammicorona]